MSIDPFDSEPKPIREPHFERWPTVMVTGHRPKLLSDSEAAWAQVALPNAAWRLRSVYGTGTAISGLALGADTWWALAALASGMHLHTFVPFEDQPAKWPQRDRDVWTELRSRATRETLVGGKTFDVRHLHARNDAMLQATREANGLVLALYKEGTGGGTHNAVNKARGLGLPLLILDPASRTVRREGW